MFRAQARNRTRVSSVLSLAALLVIASLAAAGFSGAVTFGQRALGAPLDDAPVIPPTLRPSISRVAGKAGANPSAPASPSAPLATLYVDGGGVCGGNSPCFTTIQAAINAAIPSDTINVYAGTYAEQINVNKALTVLGPNAGINPNTGSRVAEAIIIPTASDPLNPSFAGPIVVTFSAAGVTFDGFTVDGDNPGLTSGVVFNGADVDAEFGIYGDGSANLDAVITNNIAKNIGEIAIWLNTFGIGGARNANSRMTTNKVDNVLGNFGQALRISDDCWADVLNNVVTRSRVGIVIENFSGNVTTHPSSAIANNNITSFRIGIRHNLHYVYAAPGFRILLNAVQTYVQSPLPPQVTTATIYEGIRVESIQQTVPVTVAANTLVGNRATLMGAGYTRVDGMEVTNASSLSPNILFRFNVASDFIRGAFHDTPAVPTFVCNQVTGNTFGFQLSANATNALVANLNDITGNTSFGMQNNGPATVNAQQNWWGAANGPGPVGPGSGDAVSTNVDFSNWLTSASSCAAMAPTASGGVVTGRIVDAGGAPVEGAVVVLSGAQNRKFITDASGYYRFENVETNGFYNVTPSRVNYSFSPSVISFSQIGETTNATFGASLTGASVNPLDTPEYFVRQQYLDFLGREPDEAGFNFWSDQILACGADTECVDRKRTNVSAAYFLSIEFQQTGGFVDGLFRASFGRRPSYSEFKPDAGTIALGVQVGKPGWEGLLASNKESFLDAFVQRADFQSTYGNMSNEEYVDALIFNTGVSFATAEREAIVGGLAGGMTRAAALRAVVENGSFVNAKRNQAFVMMEYFGYLRREPDAAGYDYWLNKLNQFNGNFEQAEMVRSFILSTEYRQRFPR